MPKPENSPSAVVVSGGKQYRVEPGDRILVDRIAAEPGSSVKLDRVLLVNDGSEIKVGNPAISGLDVDAKVLAHRRGPRTESIRYKAKKRVRVHRGGRSYLTALEIIAVGGVGLETEEAEAAEKEEAKPKGRGRRKAEPRKKAVETKAEAAPAEETAEEEAPSAGRAQGAVKRSSRRRPTKKEDE